MPYHEDELLMLSGIQHFAYCPRQWALIHIEQLWDENHLTLEGQYLHARVDNPECKDMVRGTITLRSVPLVSYTLGICGISDAVEMHKADSGMTLPSHAGYYRPIPVEYKHGKSKLDSSDRLQVCAQGICLEEMYGVPIKKGYLYYASSKHREEVALDENLRKEVIGVCEQMHHFYDTGTTPKAEYGNKCRCCSLNDICMPKLSRIGNKVEEYINKMLDA